MHLNQIVSVVGVVLALVASGIAQDQQRGNVDVGKAKADWVEETLELVGDELGLDRAQYDKFEQIRAASVAAARAQGDQFNAKLAESRTARADGDNEKAAAITEELELLGDPSILLDEAIAQIDPMLRDEQRERMHKTIARVESHEREWEFNGRVMRSVPQELGLSGEQRGKFYQFVEQHMGAGWNNSRATIEPLLAEVKTAREAGDFLKVMELRQKINAAEMNPAKVNDALIADVKTILQGEQLTKLEGIIASRTPPAIAADAKPDAPIVLRAARRVDLSRTQRDELRRVEKSVMPTWRKAARDASARLELSTRTLEQVTKLLNEAQLAIFRTQLARLRR
ncbi:MAG: hypothetical protein ACKVS9_04575 [Phycisphaerae bacterium]